MMTIVDRNKVNVSAKLLENWQQRFFQIVLKFYHLVDKVFHFLAWRLAKLLLNLHSFWSILLLYSLILLCDDRTIGIRSIFSSLTMALYFVGWLTQLQGKNVVSKCKVKMLHQYFVYLSDSASFHVCFDFIDVLQFQHFLWKTKLIVEFTYFIL